MNIYIIFAAITVAFVAFLLMPIFAARDISKPQKRIFMILVSVLFIGGGLLLYSMVGAPEILPLIAKREVRLAELKTAITANANAIKENPKNLNAWVEMGDNFMETGQFAAARNVFKQAVLLSEGNPVLIMAYARAMIAEADGKVTDEAKKSLNMVLMLTPNNEEAHYFSAVYKLQTGDTKAAMTEMKALYRTLPETSPLKAMIDRQIGRE